MQINQGPYVLWCYGVWEQLKQPHLVKRKLSVTNFLALVFGLPSVHLIKRILV